MHSRNSALAALLLAGAGLLLGGCSTITQNQLSSFPVGNHREPRPAGSPVAVFKDSLPTRQYEVVARLNVHMEKTFFLKTAYEEILPQLEELARQRGADGIIQIKEERSQLNETFIYNVTATAVLFTE